MAAVRAGYPLSWLLASQQAHTSHEQSSGPSSLFIPPSRPHRRQGGFQNKGPPMWTFPLSQLLPRNVSPFLMPFFFPHTQLCGNVSWCFGCTRDLLPIFSWFPMRIVPHVDMFLIRLWRQVSSISSYSTILISSPIILKIGTTLRQVIEVLTLIKLVLILPYFMCLVANIFGAHTDLSWHNTPYLSCFVLSPFNPTLISTGPF